ncbi:MAG: GntR family transcriptional regulator [Pirellulaceae bacterium]|nr:GntR family transcriptional regulator [Pirellulaceae bacterium]
MLDPLVSSAVRFDRGERRQAIVGSLLSDVFAGRLRAGQHLVTQDLASRYGVSHTPIREALIALAGIGVIDLLPNRGAIVRQVSAKDVREVCQVRRLLECEAVRRACGRIDRGQLLAMAESLRSLSARTSDESPQFIAAARAIDSQLHDLIAASCGNDFLASELNRLKTLFRALRDVSWAYDEARNDYRRVAGETHEHLAIVEALLANDAREASLAMSRHIRSGVKYWSRSIPAASHPQISHNGQHGKRDRRSANCPPALSATIERTIQEDSP